MDPWDLIQWVIAVFGWAAAATILVLLSIDNEHPATRTLRWIRRLMPFTVGALIVLFGIGRIDSNSTVLRAYMLGLIAWAGVGVPIAAGVHLWRTRGLWRGEFDQGGKDRQQLGLTTPTDDASGDGETR